MFTVSVETRFWASHSVKLPDGSKEPSHRHKWLVVAEVSGNQLNDERMVMDFYRLKDMLDNIIAEFADTQLEEHEYFAKKGPSTEMIAQYIYERLKPDLPDNAKLEMIKVVEKPGFAAKFYIPDKD